LFEKSSEILGLINFAFVWRMGTSVGG